MVRPLVVLAIAVGCTLSPGAQVQPPAVSSPFKTIDRIAITRDGRQVVFAGGDTKGRSGTWLRNLGTGAMTRLEIFGQDGLRGATFSPDGQWLALWRGIAWSSERNACCADQLVLLHAESMK
jgi:hypothetical protein